MGQCGEAVRPAMRLVGPATKRPDAIQSRLLKMLVICGANALLWVGILVVTTGMI